MINYMVLVFLRTNTSNTVYIFKKQIEITKYC